MKSQLTLVVALLTVPCLLAGCSEAPQATPASTPTPAASAAKAPSATASTASSESTPPSDAAAPAKPEEKAPPADEATVARNVQTLFAGGKFDEAEAALAAAVKDYPDSSSIQMLHYVASIYLSRADKEEEAFTHLNAFALSQLESIPTRPQAAIAFGNALTQVVEFASRLHGPERAEQILNDFEDRVEKLPGAPQDLLATIAAQRAIQRARAGSVDEARSMADKLHAAAAAILEDSPEDDKAFEGVVSTLRTRLDVESAIEGGAGVVAAQTALLDFLFEQAKTHPDDQLRRSRYFDAALRYAQTLVDRDPDAAAVVLESVSAIQGNEEIEDPAAGSQRTATPASLTASAITRLRNNLQLARKRFAQYGKPADFPLHADRWVNADAPLTAESLRGKVVLLDFFAVWCGPCIATFPHLREWNEKYAERGLAIVGVSEYQSFGWDETAGHSKRVADLSPDQERDDLAKFAAFHKLAHPIALVPDNALQQHYYINGIPHVVLIDRAGNVRLYRIGNTPDNARDIEQAIEECLNEPAPAAPAATASAPGSARG